MGTASMYGRHVFEAELDCDWMTADVLITFNLSNEDMHDVVDTESVVIKETGYNISRFVNWGYIDDLIAEFLHEADYHVSDHGN